MPPRFFRFHRGARWLAAGALVLAGSLLRAADAPDPAKVEFFEKNIRPLLADHCEKCHSAAEGKAKGDLTLDSREGWSTGGEHGPAVVPGAPDKSILLKAVLYTDEDLRMPPKKEGGKLKDAEIEAIRKWIADGAADPRSSGAKKLTGLSAKARAHWLFQPVQKPAIPAVRDAAWVKTDIDAFVLARLEKEGMRPNGPAPKELLLRRVSYDLTGLPPTAEEVKAFMDDLSPQAYEKVIDRLLASPHYGERWGRHWLDTARYSDTTGHTGDGGKRFQDYRLEYAWTYRDYVVNAFNDDKPWNLFLTEQLAADLLPDLSPGDPRLAALGFLTVGKRFDNPDDTIDERIDATGKAMLGLTVACARCHDHKFDPIPIADYYSWHGIFSNITEPTDLPELPGGVDKDDRLAYEHKLSELEAKNRTVFYNFLQKRNPEFLRRAAGYLMIAAAQPRSIERQETAKRFLLFPVDVEMIRGIRLNNDHPVLGPFARLSKIPTNEFAAKAPEVLAKALLDKKAPVNRLVAEALNGMKPQDLEEVARAYGRLFANYASNAVTLVHLRAKGGSVTNLDDPAVTELVQTPFYVPVVAEIETVEKQQAFLNGVPGRKPWHGAPQFEPRSFDAFKFAEINQLRLTHPGAPGKAMVVVDKPKPADSYVHLRGDRNRRGPNVPRRFLEVLSGPDRKPFKGGSGRLELAHAIVDPKNPVTARVAVNRLWMQHFGRGFVPTPDDLGNMSEPPTHPELLDDLASQFVEQGWSVKKLHKLILLSAAFQQSSDDNPEYAVKDPDNKLLWRSNLRRLDFESVRDSLVLLTGKMDPAVGGKPVNLTEEPYSYRRSIYGYVDRLHVSDLLSQFDFSDPEMVNSRRISTVVPQQSLFFLNNSMVVDAARRLVNRPEVDDALDDEGRITALHHILYQRDPTPQEIAWARDFIDEAHKLLYGVDRPKGPRRTKAVFKKQAVLRDKYAAVQNAGVTVPRGALDAWESYAQTLLWSNEFIYVY
jgi:Protein of unknown function (DUF1553)/Protein of unknown function (DUF1549)/Planctomycete cytochrome C